MLKPLVSIVPGAELAFSAVTARTWATVHFAEATTKSANRHNDCRTCPTPIKEVCA